MKPPNSSSRRVPAVVLSLSLFALVIAPACRAGVLRRVPLDYPALAAALAAAQIGDTVAVRGGTYGGTSFTPRSGIPVLGGYDPTYSSRNPTLHETILASIGRVVTCVGGVDATAVIDGFTMTGGNGSYGGLVYVQNASPTLSNCKFVEANGGRGGGVYLQSSNSMLHDNLFSGCWSSEVGGALAVFGSNGAVIRECRFENNASSSSGGGAFVDSSPNVRFASCVFTDNQSGAHAGGLAIQVSVATVDSCIFARNSGYLGGAVGVFSSGASTLVHCTITANTAAGAAGGGGVYLNSNGRLTVTNTIVTGNTGTGLVADVGGLITPSCNDVWSNQPADYQNVTPGANSISLDPLFCDPANDVWTLRNESPCAPPNSPACGLIGALPNLCAGRFIRVPDDFPSILLALNSAENSDTVAVAEGLYLEHVTLRSHVKLLGGWRSDFAVRDPVAYPSIIDAGGFLTAVVAQNGETPTAVIDGFVIQGGNRSGDAGGGIQCYNAPPTIRNNLIRDNRASQGAAIGCLLSSAPVITGNVIVGNVALDPPGGAIFVQDDATIESNTLDGNQGPFAAGIAVRYAARPVVARNIVVNGLVGVGIFADEGAAPQTSCNDVWRNAGGNYFGVLPGPNAISADPRFCPGENHFLGEDSPCAPGQAPAPCGLIGARGVGCGAEAAAGLPGGAPRVSWLGPGAPNPLHPSAAVPFGLAHPARVRLTIFDLAGRRVRALADEMLPAGEHRRVWDGRDDPGRPVASGVYFYELVAGGERIGRRKLVVVR